jgi:DNA-binding protein YbaB
MARDEAPAAVTDEQTPADPTVVEWSGDGLLMVAVDWSGEAVRVQLEPEATRSWTADVLADRIARLHRLALMRARAEKRAQVNETGAALPTTPGWPGRAEVDEYRRSIDF